MAIRYSDELVPGGTFPLVDDSNIRGGYHCIQKRELLDNIKDDFKKIGMVCYAEDTRKAYQWNGYNWLDYEVGGGGSGGGGSSIGIPIVTKKMEDTLGSLIPKDHITIPDEKDLEGEITNNTFQTSVNGNYVDVLFKSLRALLLEVNRLKNSFKYGIESYSGKYTALSTEVPNGVEDEPLWAIEENLLSAIPEASISIDEKCQLLPKSSLNFETLGKVLINGSAYWDDSKNVLSFLDDSKILVYITSSNLLFLIILKDIDTLSNRTIDFSKFDLPKVSKYNTTIIISRNTKNSKNYLWISISDGNDTLLEGYLDGDNVVSKIKELLTTYTFLKYIFNNLSLYKCNTYTKYEDFSLEVIPSVPEEDSYKYKVAHITIRSIDSLSELNSIINQLPYNELIWCNLEQQLYIITASGAVAIGSAQKPSEGGMTEKEVLEKLKSMGIIYDSTKGLLLSNLSDVTFVNLDTNKAFKFEVDAYGELKGTEIPEVSLKDKYEKAKPNIVNFDIRGFAGLIGKQDYIDLNGKHPRRDLPFEGNADRIKIASFYAPTLNAKIFGCSHAFIELENTSDKDFPLEGCYLHYAYGDNVELEGDVTQLLHLPLRGVLRAGSTYLIRCKLYADFNDKNVKIKVKEFDLEWYVNGELLDIRRHKRNGFALTYGHPDLDTSTRLYKTNKEYIEGTKDTELSKLYIADDNPSLGKIVDTYTNIASCPYLYLDYFIDSIYFIDRIGSGLPWVPEKGKVIRDVKGDDEEYKKIDKEFDCIFKNAFELDPAMLAFQGLNKFDCSRTRWQTDKDYECLYLDQDYIEFPKTPDLKIPISLFTPRASYEKRNVSTDKTKMDLNKPNVVFCSMGMNIYTTRTFNWVSAGYLNEYVWLRKKGDSEWKQFESYTEKLVDNEEISPVFPRRKKYSMYLTNIAYSRYIGRFPGDGTLFTSHKCVLEVVEAPVMEPATYEYVVGQAKKLNPAEFDPEHSSNIKTFTLYPESYIPRIYQHSDEQGFNWMHYLVWGAAAIDLNKKINEDIQKEGNIIPIVIDTGDVVQNGTRINEWIDYYQGGQCLFDHLEVNDVVGNNDLCDTDPSILGTGDDVGKSNSFYFHLFHCQDIPENKLVTPIINNILIPSMYYLDTKDYRILMINSEITKVNCRDWFGLSSEGRVTNLYSGFKIKEDLEKDLDIYDNTNFRTTAEIGSSGDKDTTVYTKLFLLTDPISEYGTKKKIICACHEMPFTVITNSSLRFVDLSAEQDPSNLNMFTGQEAFTRCVNEKLLLIGSHLNQIDPKDNGKGMNWFSRLLEFRGIKLCIGGHKHTYACSYPLREYYFYDGDKNSKDNGPMPMLAALDKDNATWELPNYELTWKARKSETYTEDLEVTSTFTISTTKIPLVAVPGAVKPIETVRIKAFDDEGKECFYGDVFLPRYAIDTTKDLKGVVYFMCQATGYKYSSNKELPSLYQAFSLLKPKTSLDANVKFKDKPSKDLKMPMYSIINLKDNISIKLVRVQNIFDAASKFTQVFYGANEMKREYLSKAEDEYGTWSSTESDLITINYEAPVL